LAAPVLLDAQVVDLNEVRQILKNIVKDGNRAGEVISRIRDLIKKAPPRRDRWEINEVIREVIGLTHSEAVKNGVSVQTKLAVRLPLARGDQVQLQQVILNLSRERPDIAYGDWRTWDLRSGNSDTCGYGPSCRSKGNMRYENSD
jgi:C4-dicarboxylate-specific signal transduction histidine kinase